MNQIIKKHISVLMAIAFIMTTIFSMPLTVARAEGSIITVGQAIANNTGTATVEGYIVAHTTGSNSFNFIAPFANDYNVALADSPTETDKTKLLSVQLSTNFRPQFGLATNPGNIGKKIRVSGTLALYNSVPGLKSPTAMEFVESTDPHPNPGEVTIAEAKGLIGQTVTIQGVVTADNSAIGGGKLSTYIQDNTSGINVFAYDPSTYSQLKEGDQIKVKGKIADYKGLAEIMPEANGIEVLQSGQPLPEAKLTTITDLNDNIKAEPLEGQLVKLTGFVQNVPSSPSGGGYNISLVDESFRATTLRVMEGSLDINTVQPYKWYEITAILSQYNTYQIIPRKASDITLVDPQPKAPSAVGEYDSVIESVVDGDTVHITVPVLGATKVRFLNIDTPETYHTVVTEADANQKYYGEAAKAYLNTILKAGDEVTLKIGEEPTDSYGRLLAQIIKKSEGLNVNLDMVEKGYASTYFIWPIGDDYEMYSQAVKRAYDAKLGIWNETNPLVELPFVFRAREQGKGLLRYVGNYYTKKYVTPEEWAKVPVEARVFFASEQEAQMNGYTFAESIPKENIKIQMLGINDLHAKIDLTSTSTVRLGLNFGRVDYLAAYLKEREASNPNTLLIHSGDIIGGSAPISGLLQDEPTVEIMESMGFDIGTVGNHEFDEGVTELLRMINGGIDHPNGTKNYDGMNFPIVAANVQYKDTKNLVLQPYAIKEVAGVKIGFIGVVTKTTATKVMAAGISNIEFTDEAAAINKYVPELKAKGVESIVVLAHVPGDQKVNGSNVTGGSAETLQGVPVTGAIAEIAASVDDEVDIILAADNHVKLNGIVDNKLIVQAWEYGDAFADIDVEIDPVTKDIVKKSAEIVDVIQNDPSHPIQADSQVKGILDKYAEIVAPKVNAVVGINEVEMLKGYPTKGYIGDMALGNFIADGMKYAMNADFALMNGGGVRDNLNAGEVTWGELFNIQPFGNTLVKIDITGAQFKEILSAMISSYGPDSFIAGARYTWDLKTNKVVKLYLENGQEINPNAAYSLVVNNFMYTSTAYKYRLLGQYGLNPTNGPEDIEASVMFAKSFTTPIHYEAEGRISTDLTAPVITAPDKITIYQYETLNTIIEAFDALSGIKELVVKLDGNPVDAQIKVEPLMLELGTHVITVTALDKAGNEATKVINVEVIMDVNHFDELLETGLQANKVDNEIYNSLMTKVKSAQLSSEDKTRANILNALVNEIKAQSGKKIEKAFAELLISDITSLK